jgi:transcriptional regulator with XRE-family HTH domain
MTLKEIRARQMLTQMDLALMTGINQTKISLFERGYLSPNKDELLRLGEALDVQPESLVFIERRGFLKCL